MNLIGKGISLNSGEQTVCKLIAKLRFDNNRKKGVSNSKIGDQSDEDTDREGLCAEMCFAKLFNVYPDFSVFTRSSKDGEDKNGDVTIEGIPVDVKATKYVSGRLIAVPWKDAPKKFLYALMVGSFPTFTFKGFMKSSDLLSDTRLGNLGHGPTYIANQHELREWNEVWEPLEKEEDMPSLVEDPIIASFFNHLPA